VVSLFGCRRRSYHENEQTFLEVAMSEVGQATTELEYQAFPEIEGRDELQVRIEVPLLVRALHVPTGGRVLETGCGSGAALLELANRIHPTYVAGADIDRGLLDGARSRFAAAGVAADFFQVDVRLLPFSDESFDLVIDFGTCYHIGRPSIALQEISRVLRPGGLFVHETPVSQLLAHPVRSFGRTLPWFAAPALRRHRMAILWAARRKIHDIPCSNLIAPTEAQPGFD
jgi:SAM-dependent methyltransferase